MKCPHCGREIAVEKICPHCGRSIDYGGNTQFFKRGATGTITWKDIFSETFKKHRRGDMEHQLSSLRTSQADMLTSWNKPWLYARVFLFLLVLTVLLGILLPSMQTFVLVPALFIGCAVVPVTMMLFIWEMDIPRGVSIVEAVALTLLGGVISMAISFVINTELNAPAWTAGLVEEPAKLLIAVLFIAYARRPMRTLDGLAIGAAVAAGFSFMETIGYALNYSSQISFAEMVTMRSVFSLMSGHILYTAPFVGALCAATQGEKLQRKHFCDKRFLLMLALGIGAHALNNSDFSLITLIDSRTFPLEGKEILIGIVCWGMLLYLFRVGIREVLQLSDTDLKLMDALLVAKRKADATKPKAQAAKASLHWTGGEYQGLDFAVTDAQPVTMGRDPTLCSLILTASSISSAHCQLYLQNGVLYLRDLGSSNGTFCNGTRISANTAVALHASDKVFLSAPVNQFVVQ